VTGPLPTICRKVGAETGPLTLPLAFDRGETKTLAKAELEPVAPNATTAAAASMVLNVVMAVSPFGVSLGLLPIYVSSCNRSAGPVTRGTARRMWEHALDWAVHRRIDRWGVAYC
jgi:hypothetical protein